MSTAGVPAQAPKRADARRNRDRLLAAALAAFTESGADDVSLEEVARRAGLGIGTLYRHFSGRQALLEAVYRDQVEGICAFGHELLAPEDDPAASIVAWMRRVAQFGATKRSLTSALLESTGSGLPVFQACRAELRAVAAALLERAQRAGLARPGVEPADLLRLAHAVALAAQHADDHAAEADRLLSLVTGGVLQAPSRVQ